MKGRLLLAPAPLDFGCEPPLPPITDVLPHGTLQQMAQVQHWVCENAKSLRALLKRVDAVTPLACPLQALAITELPRDMHKKGDHVGQTAPAGKAQAFEAIAKTLLAPALQGHDVALASEAGMPAVADPGSSLVRAAHTLGIIVAPLAGSSALLLAIAASGLNGQNFAFVGYLPQEPAQRAKRLKELEQIAQKTGQSQMWIETPYRNQAVYAQALQVLHPATQLAVAFGLTLPAMQVVSQPVARHQNHLLALPAARLPAVFAIGV